MIFWERVNPVFDVSFDGADDYWEWEDPAGWESVDGNSMDWSMSIPEHSICGFVKDRLETLQDGQPYQDHLVIYGNDGDRWRVILLASRRDGRFTRCNTIPPLWWGGHENRLLNFLGRIQTRIETVRTIRERVGVVRSLDPKEGISLEVVEGYCSLCGLILDRHVPHKVPGYAGVGGMNIPHLTTEEHRAYVQAFRAHFQPALQKMSDEELIRMPMPTAQRYLGTMVLEVQRRLNAEPPVKDRFDRLLGEDLLDEG